MMHALSSSVHLVKEEVTLSCANTCTRSQRSFEWDLKVPWNPWCCIVMNVSLDKLIMWSIVPVLCLYLTLLKDDKHLTITCISNLHCFQDDNMHIYYDHENILHKAYCSIQEQKFTCINIFTFIFRGIYF